MKILAVDDLCQDFITDYQVNQRKSLWRAELSVNHLKEFFGGLKACNVDTELIRRYIKQRQAQGARNATINREWLHFGECSGWPSRTTEFREFLTSPYLRSGT
jgi:hypothetical protein